MSDPSLGALRRTLDTIEGEWVDLVRSDCNPLDIATPLLSDSSDWVSFQKSKAKLQKAIQTAVNAHYLVFNDSVGAYGIAEESFSQSMETLAAIRSQLQDVGAHVGKRNDLMVDLNGKRKTYGQMLETLEAIQTVNGMVDELEGCVNERNFDRSILLIKQVQDLSTGWGLTKIDSLDALFGRLQFYSDSLLEATVDDITNLVYFSCEGSYKGLEGYLRLIEGEKVSDTFRGELDTLKFADIQNRLASAHKLGREAEVLKALVNRTEREVTKVIKKCVDEIKANYPSQIELNMSATKTFNEFGPAGGMNTAIVHDLFDRMFKRLGISMQKHILIHELVKSGGNSYNIDKIWNVYQKKLGLTMCHYIINEEMFQEAAEMTNTAKNTSPFTKPPKGLEDADRGMIFHFGSLTLDKSKHDLVMALNSIFDQTGNAIDESNIVVGLDDVAQGTNKLDILVTPNIFNMGEIIDHFVQFTINVQEFYPIDNGQIVRAFYDQFMNAIYIHQLETELVYEFERSCLPSHPASIKDFFQKVLTVLDTSLHFKEKYVQIVITLLNLLKDKFANIKASLVSGTLSNLVKTWYTSGTIRAVSTESVEQMLTGLVSPLDVIANDVSMKQRFRIIQQKGLDESIKAQSGVHKLSPSTFTPIESIDSIVEMIGSMSEVGKWLPKLRRYVPELSSEIDLVSQLREVWTLSSEMVIHSRGKVFLALNNEYEDQFESIIKNISELKVDLELILRYEIRYECLYAVKKLLGECGTGSGTLDEEVSDCIDDFCDRVSYIARVVDDHAIDNEGKVWIFGGLGSWIDGLAIRECKMVRRMAKDGWVKVMVNLRVLQQLIRKVDFGAELLLAWSQSVLGRSLKYFSLGSEGDQLVNKITQMDVKTWEFSTAEYSVLVNLLYGDRSEEKRKLILDRLVG